MRAVTSMPLGPSLVYSTVVGLGSLSQTRAMAFFSYSLEKSKVRMFKEGMSLCRGKNA